MKIIFLHGLESTPETSETAKIIKETFPNVAILDYKPKNSYLEIKKYLMEYITDEDIVIGISIGGFWALHLTEFTKIKNVILLNPALIRGEERYKVKIKVGADVCGHMLLNMDDDIVDNNINSYKFEGRFLIDTFPTGGHRMSNLKEILPLIEETVEHCSYFIP